MKTLFEKALMPVITGLLLFLGSIPALAEDPPEKAIIAFGIIPLYTPQLIYERFQPLMDYLSINTPYRFKMRLTKDYKGIISLLQEGKIDVALLGGASYCLTSEKTEVVPLLKPLNPQGKPFYKSVIITREDKGINNISGLKGKSFAFASRWSTSGAVVPLYNLYNNGVNLKDFSRYFHLRYHDSVVREVLKGSYDAGAVIDTIAYSYKDKGLKFIFISEPIPELTIVVRKGAPQEIIDSVRNALLKLNHEDPKLKEWGEEIRYGFTDASDSDFDSIRNMIGYLKGQGVYLRDDED
ncbi:MAG: phosphate/phosphite/phosphonate ABC transporter substrate-binding protein [Nitrospinae bacterium]|nr:phosphate/phosphite/phosphonate ABC transporter substrate-binding protein [Nitrospinota bacterium]MBI3813667.1 phosphate/phosphite/phosphonate ABC transporter substrate-binding protein [Nitrospinota bacterium]